MNRIPIVQVDNDKIVGHTGDIIWVMWDSMTVDTARELISDITSNGDDGDSRIIYHLQEFIKEYE